MLKLATIYIYGESSNDEFEIKKYQAKSSWAKKCSNLQTERPFILVSLDTSWNMMIRKISCESVLCAAPLPTPVRGGARPCLPTRQLPSHSKQGSDLNLAPLSRPEIKGGQTITNSVQNWDSTRKIPGDIILLATYYCYLLLHYFFVSVPKKTKK